MARDTDPTYVVIHGLAPHTNKELVDYVESIVYGIPSKITTIKALRHFVAIVEFPADQFTWAKGTFERMGSFSFGGSFHLEKATAIAEFGAWCYHHAEIYVPPTVAPKE